MIINKISRYFLVFVFVFFNINSVNAFTAKHISDDSLLTAPVKCKANLKEAKMHRCMGIRQSVCCYDDSECVQRTRDNATRCYKLPFSQIKKKISDTSKLKPVANCDQNNESNRCVGINSNVCCNLGLECVQNFSNQTRCYEFGIDSDKAILGAVTKVKNILRVEKAKELEIREYDFDNLKLAGKQNSLNELGEKRTKQCVKYNKNVYCSESEVCTKDKNNGNATSCARLKGVDVSDEEVMVVLDNYDFENIYEAYDLRNVSQDEFENIMNNSSNYDDSCDDEFVMCNKDDLCVKYSEGINADVNVCVAKKNLSQETVVISEREEALKELASALGSENDAENVLNIVGFKNFYVFISSIGGVHNINEFLNQIGGIENFPNFMNQLSKDGKNGMENLSILLREVNGNVTELLVKINGINNLNMLQNNEGIFDRYAIQEKMGRKDNYTSVKFTNNENETKEVSAEFNNTTNNNVPLCCPKGYIYAKDVERLKELVRNDYTRLGVNVDDIFTKDRVQRYQKAVVNNQAFCLKQCPPIPEEGKFGYECQYNESQTVECCANPCNIKGTNNTPGSNYDAYFCAKSASQSEMRLFIKERFDEFLMVGNYLPCTGSCNYCFYKSTNNDGSSINCDDDGTCKCRQCIKNCFGLDLDDQQFKTCYYRDCKEICEEVKDPQSCSYNNGKCKNLWENMCPNDYVKIPSSYLGIAPATSVWENIDILKEWISKLKEMNTQCNKYNVAVEDISGPAVTDSYVDIIKDCEISGLCDGGCSGMSPFMNKNCRKSYCEKLKDLLSKTGQEEIVVEGSSLTSLPGLVNVPKSKIKVTKSGCTTVVENLCSEFKNKFSVDGLNKQCINPSDEIAYCSEGNKPKCMICPSTMTEELKTSTNYEEITIENMLADPTYKLIREHENPDWKAANPARWSFIECPKPCSEVKPTDNVYMCIGTDGKIYRKEFIKH